MPIPVSPEPYAYDSGESGFRPGSSTTGTGELSDTKTCKLVIQYNANGASGNPPSTSTKSYYGSKKAVTLSDTVKSSGSLTKSGYNFLGWSRNSNATTTEYNAGSTISESWAAEVGGTVTYTLYAVWTDKDLFIYKPGQYANETYDVCVPKPYETATTLKGAIFTRTGYSLTGWKLPDGTHVGNINSSYTATSHDALRLYPEWTANTYTLTFKPNGASGSNVTVSATFDSPVTIPDSSTYTKSGYTILVWNEKADGSETAWFPGQTYTYTRASNITLYAIWSGKEYYVVYNETPDEIKSVEFVLSGNDLSLDANNCLTSTAGLTKSNNILTIPSCTSSIAPRLVGKYTIATYGSPFYTEYRPEYKENHTFAGWVTRSGEALTKANYCLDSYIFGNDPTWTRTQNVVLNPVWSDDYPYGRIFFGRNESSDYGIIIEKFPDYYWPEKEYNSTEIKRKNGSILTGTTRYKNVKKSFNIAVYDKEGLQKAASRLTTFLYKYDGYNDYIRLEDSYEPDVYMLGVFNESDSLENILNEAGRGEIVFNCKPQKYLLSGNVKIDVVSNSQTIWNNTGFPALPIIKVMGTGLIKFYMRPSRGYLGDETSELLTAYLYIYNNFNEITIDCEKFTAVDINGQNMNPYISLQGAGYITFYPGQTGILCEGNIEKLSVIPRWWRL